MQWSKYNYIYDSPKHGMLLFNLISGAFIDISDPETQAEIFKLKESPDSYDFSNDKENYDFLLSAGVICENDEDNRSMMNFKLLANRFHPMARSLTILPTLNCNLACKYCFEEAHRRAGKMSREVIEKLKQHIKEQYVHGRKREYMDLRWFGGEPLLGFDIMEEITEYVKSLKIPFNASIITNGILLTDKKIQKLAPMHMNHIQITLDGAREIHDKKRIFRNGKGTYDIILKNIAKLHKYVEQNKNIQVDIRINVDKESQDQYHILYNEFKEKYPLFYVYPGIITQYQTCSTTLPCFANQREEAEFYIRQYEKYGIIHPEFNISSKGMRNCMAECIHTDMVGPQGELYLCLQDVGNKDAVIGSLFEGKNNLRLISAYCSGNFTFNSNECRDCEILTFCGGGCVNRRYRSKKYDEKHDMCAGYKDNNIFNKYLDLHYEIKKNQAYQNTK